MKKVITIIVLVLVAAGAVIYFAVKPPPEPRICYYAPGDHFVTNIKDSARLLKTTVVLELSTPDPDGSKEYFAEHNHILRDVTVFTLRSKTEEELRSDGIQELLRVEIVKNIKSSLQLDQKELDYIQTIYFNDYVIQ